LKTIAIFYQGRKQETADVARQLVPTLQKMDHKALVIDISKEKEEGRDPSLNGCDLVIVLGGDGTILNAARLCAYNNVPILGVNFGRVGFLTELEPREVEAELPHYLQRDSSVWLDKRALLQAVMEQNGQKEEFLALNDIVIARGMWPRVVQMHVWIDDHHYNNTYADGMILSTATGSTAYNMAVGGPLLHPQVKSIVLTPIAPHLAFDRALVLPPEARVRIQIFTGSQDGVFSADGQMNREIKDGATVTVQASQYEATFLRRKPATNFYQVINQKLINDSTQATNNEHAT
jgi:NAD+ kinase